MTLRFEALEDRRLLSLPGSGGGLDETSVGPTAGQVIARHIFYNGSYFDGNDVAPGPSDDGAIAPGAESAPAEDTSQQAAQVFEKRALLPGQTASFRNYTSYSNGVNGVMVDLVLAAAPEELSGADFRFRVGNDGDLGDWSLAPEPQSITVRRGAGVGGSDRLTVIWGDREIVNEWLEVTVRATSVTGLDSNDVFYWGNAVGESGDRAGDTFVDADDQLSARNDAGWPSNPAAISNPNDFNRDGKVDGDDESIAVANRTGASVPLMLISPSIQPAPVARVDMIVVDRGDAASTLSNGALSVLENDRYEVRSGDEVSVSVVTRPRLGSLTINPDGTFLYHHDNTFGTIDIFTYKISDGEAESAAVPVVVSINPFPDGASIDKDDGAGAGSLSAEDDEITINEGGTATQLDGGALSVLANDANADPLSQTVTAVLESQPRHGELSLEPDGTFTYMHDDTENFADSFTYRVNDGTHDSNVATVTIQVVPINDNTPIGKVDFLQVQEGQTVARLSSGATSLLHNDADADLPGDILTVSLRSAPANGTLLLNSDGTYSYSLLRAGRRTDFFTYVVSDGVNTSAPAPVVISVVPQPPVVPQAKDDIIGVFRGGTAIRLNDGQANLLVNDQNLDVFNGEGVATLISGPAHGTLVLNSNGTFRYQHDGGNDYRDTFNYMLSDGITESNVATVTVNIAPVDNSTRVAYPLSLSRSVESAYDPPLGGATWLVSAGDNFQDVLNAAQPGDIIELEAGATFQGKFTLPKHSSDEWIYIRSSAHESLPPEGTRVTPDDADLMPKLLAMPRERWVLRGELGAHHYRFVGIEITKDAGNSFTNQLVVLGEDSFGRRARSLDQLPHDIVFDRVYVHGTPTDGTREGIRVDGMDIAVVDSYISDIHEVGFGDTQAILGFNGAGPIKIVNNYLEAAGENILFGGADPVITVANGGIDRNHRSANCVDDPNDSEEEICGLVPSDIEIRGNHFFKPLAWNEWDPSFAGIAWGVKNHFELKNAQRVLIEGNVFENVWPHAQSGNSIQLTPRNSYRTAPWATIEDVTFSKNIFRNVASGINMLPTDSATGRRSDNLKRLLIRDNLFEDVRNRIFELASSAAPDFQPAEDVIIEHNTVLHTSADRIFFITGDSTTVVSDFVFRNNIATGFFAGTGTSPGLRTMNRYLENFFFRRNVVIGGGNANAYPTGNFFVQSTNDVGFVDATLGDFRLAQTSPYRGAGTGQRDVGADIDGLLEATMIAIGGQA